MLGKAQAPDWLVVDLLLAHFSAHKAQALRLFVQFVNENEQQDLWDNLSNQIFLGDEDFAKQFLPSGDDSQLLSEMPKVQKRPAPEPLSFFQTTYRDHTVTIVQAHLCGGYTMAEIARYFGVHRSIVGKIMIKRAAEERG